MNIFWAKASALFLLSTLLVVFTHCGDPFQNPSSLGFKSSAFKGPDADGDGDSDVYDAVLSHTAFAKTVYPLTRANCVACHSSTQPLHASSKVLEAHDAVVENFKVNFSNIPSSRLVAKLRDENHNCWGDCKENAREMQEAIEEWHKEISFSAPEPPSEPGVPPVSLALTTEQTRPLQQELNDSANPLKTDSVRLDVEMAMLSAPMQRSRDGDGVFLFVPNNGAEATLNATASGAGSAFFNFRAPAAGNYRLWGLVGAASENDNSMYVTLSGANVSNRVWDAPPSGKLEWREVPGTFPLAAGNHSLELRQRKDGFKIYSLILTAHEAFDGREVNDYIGVTLVFDIGRISGVPGASFQVDLSEYDAYTYKLSRPRVVVPPGQRIRVKGIKPLMNRVYNPQHSTYATVNHVASETTSVLSPSSMLVIKDHGLLRDQLSFSFEQLSLTTDEPGSSPEPGIPTDGANSLAAYTDSVYQVSRTNCIACHTMQNPRHAADNNVTAHDVVLGNGLVNFTDPNSSRLVQKVRSGHNCGNQTNCDNIANEFLMAIEEWKTKRD